MKYNYISNKNISLKEKHIKFIKTQSHCSFCEKKLEIHVESCLETDTLKEEAHCASCNINTRIKAHKIQ